MKLLKIEIENLNSLYGHHSVDFEKDLLGSPLFLIMGSTGAGKSTLMDAMSLSLFGQTPRLIKSKTDKDSENDCRQVMSRGTAYAFSQLTFTKLENGKLEKYRATWQCERAYKKPDGNFKDPRRILEKYIPEFNEWEQIVSDHRPKFFEPHFNRVLENLTVDDFKRMVLLAQGEFAAFLKANEEERAAILERLTNTEIYKDIGKKASEKKKSYEEKLNQATLKFNGIQILSLEEETKLINENIELNEKIISSEKNIEILNKNIEWLDKKKYLEEKFNESLIAFKNYENKYKENIEIIFNIEQYHKFKNAIQYIIKEEMLNCDLLKLKLDKEKNQENLNILKTHITFISNNIKHYQESYDSAKNILDTKKPEIYKGKELRFQKNNLLLELEDKKNKIEQVSKENENIIHLKNILEKKYLQIKTNQTELYNVVKKDLNNMFLNYNLFLKSSNEVKNKFDFLKKEVISLSIPFDNPQEKLISLIKKRDLFNLEKSSMSKISFYLEELQKKEIELTDLEKKHEELEKNILKENENYSFTKNTFDYELNEISIIKSQVSDLSWRIGLAEQRKHLNLGENCPLCGSLDHPYFKEAAFKNSDLEILEKHQFLTSQLIFKEESYHNSLTTLNQIEKNVFIFTQDIKNMNSQINSLKKGIEDKKNTLIDMFREKNCSQIIKNSDQFYNVLRELEKNNEDNLKFTDLDIKKISENFESYNQIKEQYIENKNNESNYLRYIQELSDVLKYLDPNFDLDAFKKLIQYDNILLENIVFDEKKYFDKYRMIESEKSEISHKLVEADKDVLLNEKIIQNLKQEFVFIDKKLNTLDLDISSVLNGEDPEKFENELNDAVNAKYIKLTQEQKIFNEKEKNYVVLKNQLENIISQENQMNDSLFLIHDFLKNEFIKLGAHNKDEIIKYNLNEDDYKKFHIIYTELEKIKISTTELKNQRELDLKKHQDTNTDDKFNNNYDFLQNNKKELLFLIDNLKENKSNISQKIISNDENKNQSTKFYEELKEIQHEYSIWQRLHQIIGINNGDQFKKFAQILNLEELISKANYHLSRFEKRYSLAPAIDTENKPRLAFAIKDSYHANELRSFKTLSGGETFLVSLALALALADYRSVRMPIETILLDEGFGTLDPETLQVAMGALESLYSNGTQVGIISHVESLKESIGARIIVEKLGNGHSSIKVENL